MNIPIVLEMCEGVRRVDGELKERERMWRVENKMIGLGIRMGKVGDKVGQKEVEE